MPVTVTPETFTYVDYDATAIAALAEQLLGEIGLDDLAVVVDVLERTPLSRVHITSLDPVTVSVEGGAFEDLRYQRTLDPDRVVDALGLPLFQVRDRMDPAFGAPGVDDEVPLPHRVAWNAYAMGRLAGLGHRSQRQRWLFHFRNRHGFTDAADAAFDRLWTADGLTWAAIVALSDSVRPVAA